MLKFLAVAAICWPACSQSAPELKDILARIEKLEQENAALRDEVRQLRQEVAQSAGRQKEAQEIQARRVEEQAQTKVEASQRFPLRVTGMALFNVWHGGRNSGGSDLPIVAGAAPGYRVAGATLRQSIVGLEYHGPATLWGGAVSGSMAVDFFNGVTGQDYNYARLRTAVIQVDWKSRGLRVGQEKPIFAPRNPNSLAQVGYSPLTGAGNLWRWQPQVRFEQRIQAGERAGLKAQLGFLETSEEYGYASSAQAAGGYLEVDRRRPGLEGRFEFFARLDESRRVEIAPGFHVSTSHVDGQPAPSRLFSLDWFANPWARLEFSGAFFTGRNVAHFGALRQGFRVLPDGRVIPVHARGGWGQVSLPATSRITFNVFGGVHDDRNRDLGGSGIAVNRVGAANVMYRIAPNVIVSFEGMRFRTTYLGSGNRLNTRYDLGVAYLF